MYTSNASVLNRMRLTCQSTSTGLVRTNIDLGNMNGEVLQTADFTDEREPIIHAMNEVILHRGKSPHLTLLNISIDGVFLTEAIVPTPHTANPPFVIDANTVAGRATVSFYQHQQARQPIPSRPQDP